MERLNDVSFEYSNRGKVVVLAEHQSAIKPNMAEKRRKPVKFLIVFIRADNYH
jgi:hypothetical protein